MIHVSAKDFNAAVTLAGAALEPKNTIPVLSTMKARANGRLELEATDLDMTAKVAIPCDAATPAEFLIANPRGLLSAINAAGGSTVTLQPADGDESGFRATAGQLQRECTSRIPVEDFPADPALIADTHFRATLTVEALREIERVAGAISREETRYYLNGINVKRLDADGWTFRFAATDGHRLHVVDVPLPDAAGDLPESLILPRAFVAALFAHFRKAEGPLALEVGTGVARNVVDSTAPPRAALPRVALSGRIGNADVRFAGKTIDGTYPDYSRVIPAEPSKQALFAVADLRRAVLAVTGGIAKDAMPATSLAFDKHGCTVGLFSTMDGVTARYRIDCQHNVEPGWSIGFRGQYVLDILNVIRGAEATFGFDDPASPTVIRDTADPAFLAVLMPMRI